MKRGYQALGAALLALYSMVEISGWEMPFGSARASVPPSARNAGGYRSFHFWHGGK